MSAVEIFYNRVTEIYDGFEVAEKQELMKRLASKAKEDGLFAAPTTIGMVGSGPAVVAKAKKPWRRKKPYWTKTFKSFDASAKGADCIVGDYFHDLKDVVNVGGYYVVGFRAEPKTYALMKREDGSNITIGHDGRDHVFEDSDIAESCDSFKELQEKLKLLS